MCAGLDPRTRLDVEMIVSELATNAVMHARTAFHLEIDSDEYSVRVEVVDGSNEVPLPRVSTDPIGGHGLQLVDRLASDWGSVMAPLGGKHVWVRLDLPPGGDRL
jgi:phosphoserine phosphatase RsbU/P